MVDPLGKLLTEIRDYPAVAALGVRVRGGEMVGGADPDWATEDDPVTGVTRFKHRVIVLTRLSATREKRVPIQHVRIGAKAYGLSFQDAAVVYGVMSDAVHNVGPRISGTGVVIYRSFDDTGGSAEKDPNTGQPYESGVIALAAATVPIA